LTLVLIAFSRLSAIQLTENPSISLFVSPTGLDTNPGTEKEPLLTPNAALDFLESKQKPGEITFAQGTYLMTPAKIHSNKVKLVGDGKCHITFAADETKPLLTVVESEFEANGLTFDIPSPNDVVMNLVDTESSIIRCEFIGAETDSDGRKKPLVQQVGGNSAIDSCTISNFFFLPTPTGTFLFVGGKHPEAILTDSSFTNIKKATCGAVCNTDPDVAGGVRVLAQFCDFAGVQLPIMGKGVIHLSSAIGNGHLTVTNCDFPGHYHVSGGVLFQQEELTLDETGKLADFGFMAFPVLPPSATPEGGWIYAEYLSLNNEAPDYFSSSIFAEDPSVAEPDPDAPIGMPLRYSDPSLLSADVPRTFSNTSPSRPHILPYPYPSPKEICGEIEGHTLHLQTPCRPIITPNATEPQAMPQSIQHLYIQLKEEHPPTEEKVETPHNKIPTAAFVMVHCLQINMKMTKDEE